MSQISIIHEYEILYSNRIYQKDKKWSDGKLKFYEFNNKLEIFNLNNVLIQTDFLRDKPIATILTKWLETGNEFKLPNNKLIIQVQEYIGLFEKDLTNAFKNTNPDAVPPIAKKRKLQNGEDFLNKGDSNTPLKIGLIGEADNSKKLLRGPSRPSRFQSERFPQKKSQNQASISNREHIDLDSKTAPDFERELKKETTAKSTNATSIFHLQNLRVSQRKPIRIMPKSSTHFQHLKVETEDNEFKPLCKGTNSFQITPLNSQISVQSQAKNHPEFIPSKLDHSSGSRRIETDIPEFIYHMSDFDESDASQNLRNDNVNHNIFNIKNDMIYDLDFDDFTDSN